LFWTPLALIVRKKTVETFTHFYVRRKKESHSRHHFNKISSYWQSGQQHTLKNGLYKLWILNLHSSHTELYPPLLPYSYLYLLGS